MVLLSAIGGAAYVSGGMFSYNRKNFMFDKAQRQKEIFQGQSMAIEQFELYREDVRDLVDLTVKKMDNYLVVNTLQLSFCITLYVEGRPEAEDKVPGWLLWQFSICNVGAFLYYLLRQTGVTHPTVGDPDTVSTVG